MSFAIDFQENIWYRRHGSDSLYCFNVKANNTVSYPFEGDAQKINATGYNILFPDRYTMLLAFGTDDASIIYKVSLDSLMNHKEQRIKATNISGISAAFYRNYTDREGNWWIASASGVYL
jgi:hypothetical protein